MQRVSKISSTPENQTQKCLAAVTEGSSEAPAEADSSSLQHSTWPPQKVYCPGFLKTQNQAITLGIMGQCTGREISQRRRSHFVIIIVRDKDETAWRHQSSLQEGPRDISHRNETKAESLCKSSSGILSLNFRYPLTSKVGV